MEKLQNESDAAYRIRCRLVERHGCKFEPGHKACFFSDIYFPDTEEQTVVYFLDSLYAALMAPEQKIAFRSFVQAAEYSSITKYRYLRHHWETAYHEAKMRIESFLEG